MATLADRLRRRVRAHGRRGHWASAVPRLSQPPHPKRERKRDDRLGRGAAGVSVIKFDMQRTVASQPSTRAGMNSPTDLGIQRGEPLRDGHANAMGLTARSATKLEAPPGPVADGKFHAAARPGSGAMNVSALG
jgi:hypothetical protein